MVADHKALGTYEQIEMSDRNVIGDLTFRDIDHRETYPHAFSDLVPEQAPQQRTFKYARHDGNNSSDK
jgi:hypothetical protein